MKKKFEEQANDVSIYPDSLGFVVTSGVPYEMPVDSLLC